MKTCCRCEIIQDKKNFYKNKRSKDGFSYYCRNCFNKQKRERRKNDFEYREILRIKERNNYRRRHGLDINAPIMRAEKGTGWINFQGYQVFKFKNHPYANKGGGILGHVKVMSEYLGRKLKKGESVHHKNGIRHDNRIENLELWSSKHGPGQRVEDKIKWCIDFLNEYGYDVNKRV